ncbi:MAG: tetratricopeptide repeat protein, partial [Nodularia sp. (in: cyanobacteria)]|nr:tetratricopeptide repeat protein [Nodularia sp. (in: cyanobacteria)]
GDYKKAIKYYEERLLLARKIKDSRIEKEALAKLIFTCKALGDYVKAMQYQEGKSTNS